MVRPLALLAVLLLLSACAARPAPGDAAPQLPNPASKYCIEQGHNLTIETAPDGSQAGYCVFSDGRRCDEWAYYRGECTDS